MSNRRKLSNGVSQNVFTKASLKTNAKNLTPHLMRGGYRM